MIGETLITKSLFVKPKFPKKDVLEFGGQTDDVKKLSSRSRSVSPRPRVTFGNDYSENKSLEHITVPKPFRFEEREQYKPKSIREKWLEKTIKEKKDEEDKHINFKYKASDVPYEVMRPKYESLKKALNERSLQVKQTSAQRTKELEKPFSFYIREQEKPKKEVPKQEEYKFKANPIP